MVVPSLAEHRAAESRSGAERLHLRADGGVRTGQTAMPGACGATRPNNHLGVAGFGPTPYSSVANLRTGAAGGGRDSASPLAPCGKRGETYSLLELTAVFWAISYPRAIRRVVFFP